MAITGTLSITGLITGLVNGSRPIGSTPIVATAGVDNIQNLTLIATTNGLTTGLNTVTMPAGSTICLITPAPGNTVALAIGGTSATALNQMISIHATNPTMFSVGTAANFYISCLHASLTAATVEVLFF